MLISRILIKMGSYAELNHIQRPENPSYNYYTRYAAGRQTTMHQNLTPSYETKKGDNIIPYTSKTYGDAIQHETSYNNSRPVLASTCVNCSNHDCLTIVNQSIQCINCNAQITRQS